MTRKYEYNKANFITGVTNINNKNVKTSYRYSYYPDGNIAHYVNHYNATIDYTYDSANRHDSKENYIRMIMIRLKKRFLNFEINKYHYIVNQFIRSIW